MIDQYDIDLLKKWLKLAQTEGTDAIKITSSDDHLGECEAAYEVLIMEKETLSV